MTAAPAHDLPRGFARWITANVGLGLPQSMAPITFGLATLSKGRVNEGALMMLAMTVTQLMGAVPITAAGRRFSVTAYAQVLTGFRTVAFVGLLLAIVAGAPLPALVIAAGLAGIVNGAIYGLLRAIPVDIVSSDKLPRALGLAATANELVFVSGPILASAIGGVSVIAAVGAMALASLLPVIALPRITHRPPPAPILGRREPMPIGTIGWSLAQTSATACVASIEVGAVALALRYHLAPDAAFLFTVPLCLASVLGGTWVSIRNRRLRQRTVIAMLFLTGLGTLTISQETQIAFALPGVILVGLFLAPLNTSFSLKIEGILPPARRAEGFALLRTSHAIGLIIASSVIALGSLEASFLVSAALAFTTATAILTVRSPQRRG